MYSQYVEFYEKKKDLKALPILVFVVMIYIVLFE